MTAGPLTVLDDGQYAMNKSKDRSATSPCEPESIRPVRCRAGEAHARKAYCPGAPDARAHGEADAIVELLRIPRRRRMCTPGAVGQRPQFVRAVPLFSISPA